MIPSPMIGFPPPPFLAMLLLSHRQELGTDQNNPTFGGPRKRFWRRYPLHHLPPKTKSHDTFPPSPVCRFSAELEKPGNLQIIQAWGQRPKISPKSPFWERGSGGGQRYRCIPQCAANKLGKIPQKWELQIPSFEDFFGEKNSLGLVPASVPHTLGYTCTLYSPTSPLPTLGCIFTLLLCGNRSRFRLKPLVKTRKFIRERTKRALVKALFEARLRPYY